MNKDAEAVIQLLAWLLQESGPAVSAPSGENSSHLTGPDNSGRMGLQSSHGEPFRSSEADAASLSLDCSSSSPNWETSSLKFGEIPAVQDRFHTLLKRRLRAEIERNPPLFPWETTVYDSEYSDWVVPELVSTPLWATQLQNFNLPIPMPDALLLTLFDQCQAVVQSSLREGTKLIQAVESLFPGQSQALNQLAGLVLASPSRSGLVAHTRTTSPGSFGFPSHYDVATPAQQMALSLLAAREMLEAMTLKVEPDQSLERQWLTAVGVLTIKAEYHPQLNHCVRIQGQLPCQGSLHFQSGIDSTVTRSSKSGELSVEVLDVMPNQTYSLEVQLDDAGESLLRLAICPQVAV
jgi:hypothetical protein